MPRKKKESLEQKKKTVVTKIAFGVLIAMLILVTNAYVSRQANIREEAVKRRAQANTEDILGLSTEDEELAQRVIAQARTLSAQVESETKKIADESKAEAEKTFNELVYSSTIEPLIKRIQGLPEDQQDYIKEAICAEPLLE